MRITESKLRGLIRDILVESTRKQFKITQEEVDFVRNSTENNSSVTDIANDENFAKSRRDHYRNVAGISEIQIFNKLSDLVRRIKRQKLGIEPKHKKQKIYSQSDIDLVEREFTSGKTSDQIAANPDFMKGHKGNKKFSVSSILSRELNISKKDRASVSSRQYDESDVALFKVMWDEGKTFEQMLDNPSFFTRKKQKLISQGKSKEEIYHTIRPTIQGIKDEFYADIKRVHQEFRRTYSDSDVEYLKVEMEKGRKVSSISRDENFLSSFKDTKSEEIRKDAEDKGINLTDEEVYKSVIPFVILKANGIKNRKLNHLVKKRKK